MLIYCNRCHCKKDKSCFSINQKTDEYYKTCDTCREKNKKQHKIYYDNNKEELKEKHKIYYDNNKEELKEKKKIYRENNKEEIKKRRKIHYDNNKEELKEKSKIYYDNNKEEIKEKHKIYYDNNKEEINEKNKIYRENNKEEIKEKYKIYYDNNKEELKEKSKIYRENHKEEINEKNKIYRENHKEERKIYRYSKVTKLLYRKYANLLVSYNPKEDETDDYVQFQCKKCKKYFYPTTMQFYSFLHQNVHMYCSQKCKDECPIYGKKEKQYIKEQNGTIEDLDLHINREDAFLPEVKEMIKEMDNYECQMCGKKETETERLEVHHEVPFKVNPVMASDIDNLVTLCHDCHKKVHMEMGCRYIDLANLPSPCSLATGTDDITIDDFID